MRVLVVTHYFPEHGGGIEIVAGQIATRLAAQGVAIEWIASREPDRTTTAPGARPVGAMNVTERLLGIPYPLWGPRAVVQLARAIRRADIIHLHDSLYAGNVAASILARRSRKPVLVTQHVGLIPYRSRIARALMDRGNRSVAARVLRHAACVVFCSRTTERYFAPLVPRAAYTFVPNGVDTALCHPLALTERRLLRRELGWPDDRLVFLFVGRYVEKKGLHVLRALAAALPEVTWVFAGWGPEDPARWNAPNVVALGRRTSSEIVPLYQAADLLVLPSVGEGFPLVVQESMACGTPVAIGRETARAHPGLDPLVWQAEPCPDAFHDLLTSIASKPQALANRRDAVARFARDTWDWDRCAHIYLELLGRLARLPPTAAGSA